MHLRRKVLIVAAGLLLAGPSGAETWRTTKGLSIEGSLKAVHGPYALITQSSRSSLVPVEHLNEESMARVADFMLANPGTNPPRWSESSGPVSRELRGKLRILEGGQSVTFDPGDRPEPEFFLVYFSAHWCGPCRRFTPRLIETYHELQRMAPGRFELVFISSDEGAREQEKYVKEANMPWPFLRFKSIGSARSLERWAGGGIPCLVVLDRDGQMLFHSYRGDEYLGPDDPLGRFKTFLQDIGESRRGADPRLHRLAVLLRVRSEKGDKSPALYWKAPAQASYQVKEGNSFSAVFRIDAKGRVESVHPDENISDISGMRFRGEAAGWLFLPAMQGGVPVNGEKKITIRLVPSGPEAGDKDEGAAPGDQAGS